MLLPAQVAPHLQHRDKLVRGLAIRYFAEAHDPSPVTADDLWQVIDRYPNEDAAFWSLHLLPQTEASLRRTVEILKTPIRSRYQDALERVLKNLSYGLLIRYRDLVENLLGASKDLSDTLKQRFELIEVPAPQLLDRLRQIASAPREVDFLTGDRLVEALARSPESSQWALTALGDSSVDDVERCFALRLLGTMRFRQARDMYVKFLAESEDCEIITEAAAEALIRTGGADAVRIVHDRFPQFPRDVQLSAIQIFARVKVPQSEIAVSQLLKVAAGDDVRTFLAGAACELAATEPQLLEQLRRILKTGAWDGSMIDLASDAQALFTMIGQELPAMKEAGSSWNAEGWDDGDCEDGDWEQLPASERDAEIFVPKPSAISMQQPNAAPMGVPKPIRRESRKVGRNDPCPCGSGKKFKKCCGK